MARKTSTLQNIDSDVARELEEALNIDLNPGGSDGDLDIAASMAELEAQISRAADELAREEKAQKEAAAAATKSQRELKQESAPARPIEVAKPQQTANAAPKACRSWSRNSKRVWMRISQRSNASRSGACLLSLASSTHCRSTSSWRDW